MNYKKNIFFLVLLTISILFLACTRKESSLPMFNYSLINDSCSSFTEDECFKNEQCRGVYGPSCRICEDIKFKGCQEISKETLEKSKLDKSFCKQTGGH